MRPPGTPLLLLGAMAIALTACAGDSGPTLGDMRYQFFALSHCGAGACDSVFTAVEPGDTVGFFLLIQDDTPDTTALPRVRPICATNLEIRHALIPEAGFDYPATPTCPDSTILGGDNWPRSLTTGRIYYIGIPDGLPPGDYTVTSKLLAEPRVDRTTKITIK